MHPIGAVIRRRPHRRGLHVRAFADDWNATLTRHPQTVLASYLSSQSTTFLGLYASLSVLLDVALLPPSLAAGWAISKITKKFRQPINVAFAAVLVKAFPILGRVKVTPLVTGFVMPAKDKKVIAKQVEENAPADVATSFANSVSNGVKWLEGPVDRYGLSYYLSSRISGVMTICTSAYLIHHGVDITAYLLSDWGAVGEGIGEAAGTAAMASVCNVIFVPFHFYSSVYGVRSLEGMVQSAAVGIVDGKIEAEEEFRRDYGDEEDHDDKSGYRREEEYERIADGAMRSATMLLLTYSLVVSLYSFRLMGETATKPLSNEGKSDAAAEDK